MIDILASLVPVCPEPGCNRVMVRRDWNTSRPYALCVVCGKSHFYRKDGLIVMSATLRKAA